MKLGIVASEFPPTFGGMEQHARGLADTLSRHFNLTVYTSIQHQCYPYNYVYPVKPILNRKRSDLAVLKSEPADAFLTLNAAYSVLSTYTSKPVFCYCHGRDFLKPWIQILPSFMLRNVLRLHRVPYLRRYRERLHVALDRRQVAKGLQKAKAVFVNSTWTQQRLSELYKNLKVPIHISYPGLPEHYFNPLTRRIGKSTAVWNFITVGRLTAAAPKKNVDKVLCALASIKHDVKFQYTVIGDGDLRDDLQRLATHLALDEQTKFTGNLANEDVRMRLDNSDLLILPSVESFGIVYAEAAARGLPCLASRAGGATDAVSHGVSGILIERSDPESIAAGIREFVQRSDQFDPVKVQEFAKQFRWQNTVKVIQKTIAEY